ncbi:type ISP restriction/modification enzyme [Cerasicoccus fimbriatus]|uniref:type ISP restriction/modification enzyme n=1 Tax=Cerasicoccus fimbriatus TaxID=3014554 RepID=UPI0022B59317|nr:type ISP restriction/modification enzyme [Cerasicoccus sp. TK19100]
MPTTDSFADLCQAYLQELANVLTHEQAQHELALRPALADFLSKAQAQMGRPGKLLHEISAAKGDQHEKSIGRPDFLFAEDKTQVPLGYVEAEGIEKEWKSLKGHAKEQNERYRKNLDNFLYTNHLDFRLFVDGEMVAQARLPEPENLGFKLLSSKDTADLYNLLDRFFAAEAESLAPLKSPEMLAKALARRAKQLKAQTASAYEHGSDFLQKLHGAFKENLIAQMSADEFADLFAQTLAYGMFAARVAKPQDDGKRFDRRHAAELIPETNPFLRELFEIVSGNKLEDALRWIADDIARLLDKAPLVSIRSKTNAAGKQDVVIHFYETFLKEYDPKLRELRGVYYTPQSVVSYIVRSLDKLLKAKFPDEKGKPRFPLGLADPAVKILDPATGTGTFLSEVIAHIHQSFKDANNLGAWDASYIEEKLTPRLFAFELLVAPYTIAHLKLNLQLRDSCPGYAQGKRRLNVYLTNTLEPPQAHPELPLVEFVSNENNLGAQIKAREDILVILGNPPYSGHSANLSKDAKGKLTAIGKLLHGEPIIEADKQLKLKADARKQPNYFQCDGKPLGERNPKWLNDDYVKFIRFAQWRIDRTGEGVVGYITNHGYLDNPTFRGMRQALMQSFDEIYVLDLHGNDRKKEKAPDGSRDENVFDIQQGVAILLAVKKPADPNKKQNCRVFHADLWGKRTINGGKYRYLYDNDVDSTEWTEIEPEKPRYHFFVPNEKSVEFKDYMSVDSIFMEKSMGMNTHRDSLIIDPNKKALLGRLEHLFSQHLSDEEAINRFKLKKTSDFDPIKARKAYLNVENWSDKIVECLYKPFDRQFLFYAEEFIDRPRKKLNDQLLNRNLSLLTTKQTKEDFACLCSDKIAGQHKICARYDGSLFFPLYLYDDPSNPEARRPNFSEEFLKTLASRLKLPRVDTPQPENLAIVGMLPPNAADSKSSASTEPTAPQYAGMPEGISPEDVFHYAYAVFHSPTYRTRYAEFLKIDFPRLPLTRSIRRFRALADLGAQLTALHLLDADAAPALAQAASRHPYPESGSGLIEKPVFKPSKEKDQPGRVYINAHQYFDHVPSAVWQFRVGGYQPAEKWLKDRKLRTLTHEDVAHYQKMLVAMAETQRLMPEVDTLIGEWPIK